MEYIHSKDIFYLLRDTLKLFDRRPIVHGGKVAYYVYRMLKQKNQMESFELADIVFLVTFHDIGAYKTDDIEQMLQFETKSYRAHSLYGQLFLNGLTTAGDLATVVLYHHADYEALAKSGFSESELASYIHLAEAIDIFRESLGGKFSLDIFKKNVGKKFSPEAFDLFCKAQAEHDLFAQVDSRTYLKELDELMDSFILTNEDKEKFIQLLMFTISLKSDVLIKKAVSCVAMCEKLGALMKLTADQQKNLVYAAYVHDIGYIAFRKNWLENPERISAAHLEKIAQHTIFMEQLLKGRMKREVIVIAAAHHERVDGKGYPRRLTDKQMSHSQLILQLADAIADMMISPIDRAKTIEKVKRQTDSGWFSSAVTKVFIDNFDEIAAYTEERSNKILKSLNKLNEQYESIKEANG